jgi:rhamnosyltransferase subunit B
MTTFLMAAHGTDGDVLPVIRIGRELVRRGHQVALLSHARYSQRARRAGMRFVAIDTVSADDNSQADDDAGINQLGERRDLARVREYYERHGFFGQFRFECRALRRLHRPGETVLVGLSLSSLSVLTAAELLGAPAVCLAASPFHLSVLDRAAAEYAQVFGPGVDEVRGEFGLGPVRNWTQWLVSPDARVGTWPAWFDAAGDPAPPDVHLTGFVLADEDDDADRPGAPEVSELSELSGVSGVSYVDGARGAGRASAGGEGQDEGSYGIDNGKDKGEDEGRSLPLVDGDSVLIAGSSGRLTTSGFYRAAVAAVVAVGRPALVVTRDRDLVPEPLPPAVRWFPRLPFREVMPRVAAVVHHGGIGTAARALVAGAPQLVLAAGFDRPDNARRLAAASLAEWLPESELAPAEVADRLSTVLARGRVTAPPGTGPVDAVAAAADALEKPPPH